MSSKKSDRGPSEDINPDIHGSNSWNMENNKTTIFQPCMTRLDSKTGNIINATNSDIFKCCLERCKPNFCTDICNNHIDQIFPSKFRWSKFTRDELIARCLGNCRIMNTLCIQDCKGMTPGFEIDNYYYNCAIDNHCTLGLGEIPDKDCIENNKDVIFNCCRSRCQPTSVTDCQELCETLQQSIIDPKSLGIPDDMSIFAHELQNKTLLSGKLEKQVPGEKDKTDSQLKKIPQGDILQGGRVYPYLGMAIVSGLIIAICIIISIYLYHKKRK